MGTADFQIPRSGLPPGAVVVCAELLDRLNSKTLRACPSEARMAALTGLSLGWVRKGAKRLVAEGWLRR